MTQKGARHRHDAITQSEFLLHEFWYSKSAQCHRISDSHAEYYREMQYKDNSFTDGYISIEMRVQDKQCIYNFIVQIDRYARACFI